MKKDVLFIWLPKTAGTSIYENLKKYNCQKLKNMDYFLTSFNNKGFVTFGHIDIFYLLKNKIIEEKYFKNAFKFCFVRNPWGRLVSLYFYLRTNKKISLKISFENFCMTIKKGIPPIGPYNTKGLSQANPQVDWITDKKGKIIVDFIGRFENFEQDINKVFEIIGIKEEIPHLNKTSHKNYRSYYSNKTKRIVSKIYKKDIELLEYEF